MTVVTLCAALLTGCSDKGGDDGNKSISVPDQTQLDQVVAADDTEGTSGVRFTTTGPWTSSIDEVAAKGGAPDWVSISPAEGSAAGEYNVQITLIPNDKAEARRAQIKILCDGSVITITVEQKGVGQPVGNERRIAKLKTRDHDYIGEIRFSYDAQGRISGYQMYDGTTLSGKSTLTYADNKITYYSEYYDAEEMPDGEPETYQIVYTLVDGRVVSGREAGEDFDCDTWQYDAAGYKSRWSDAYELGNVDSEGNVSTVRYEDVVRYAWSGGDLVGATLTYGGSESSREFSYKYTDREMKPLALDLNLLLSEDEDDIPGMFGWTGHRSKHLLSEWTITGDEWGKDNGTTKLRFDFDNDGYVTKVYSTWTAFGEESDEEVITEVVYE